VAAHATHGRASTAYAAEVRQGPLQGCTDARRNLNAEVLREAHKWRWLVPPASFWHAFHLRSGMVTMRSRQLLFSRVDEGAGDLNYFGKRRYRRFVSKHGLSMQWRRRLANPRII
jgi:hypothetical protein